MPGISISFLEVFDDEVINLLEAETISPIWPKKLNKPEYSDKLLINDDFSLNRTEYEVIETEFSKNLKSKIINLYKDIQNKFEILNDLDRVSGDGNYFYY
jgi:hypothetical protein